LNLVLDNDGSEEAPPMIDTAFNTFSAMNVADVVVESAPPPRMLLNKGRVLLLLFRNRPLAVLTPLAIADVMTLR